MRSLGRFLPVVPVLFVLACSGGGGDGADTSTAQDSPQDRADGDSPAVATWTDPASGLTWEANPTDAEVDWYQAGEHCRALDGASGWRLPSIDDLRTLIRGCPETAWGGACRETVACSGAGSDCYDGEACMGCEWMKGPGTAGCFRPSQVQGLCDWTWSSTTAADVTGYACFAHFANGHLSHDDKRNALTHHVICVK